MTLLASLKSDSGSAPSARMHDETVCGGTGVRGDGETAQLSLSRSLALSLTLAHF
jgi:hypothetical protein